MKAPLKWLKEYVAITSSADDIARRLTLAGLEVKDAQVIGGEWENIVVGQIVAIEPHPNADRLRLTTIDVGTEKMSVVTGAPNLRLNDKVAFARVGAQLTDPHTGEKFRLKSAKIRGVVSNGMACSEKELGISDEHEGIMILPADAPAGMPLTDYLGDVIFDLEITPNRADCLSIMGIAREIAALTGQPMHYPQTGYEETASSIEQQISVEITAPDLCPRYCASLISGVKLAPSPAWMQHRLQAYGMRPVNNIVDITNYVMLEYGQPLHAFDYSKIEGKKIIVRRAAGGESLVSLDGAQRVLSKDMLVIADASRPVAVAGVMGSANSEVTEQTSSILLEAANFKPASIYHTGHNLGLPSEARMRFERGIRAELAMPALKRATQLIVELAGGKAANGVIDVYPGKREPKPISLSTKKIKRLLDVDLNLGQIESALTNLGFDCQKKSDSELQVTAPYWRNDIHFEVDLVEEVARITGYDKIPMTMLSQPIPRQNPAPILNLKQEIRHSLIGLGIQEIITYSLVGLDSLNKLTPEPHPLENTTLRVANPMTADQEYLRPNIRANLLAGFIANRRHEDGAIRLFELDKVYLKRAGDLPDERYMLCSVLGGPRAEKSWYGGGEPVDFFDAKGVVESLFDHLGLRVEFEKSNDESLHPNKQAAIVCAGQRMGVVGEFHPRVLAAFEIAEPVYLFEVDVSSLTPCTVEHKRFQPIPKFPAVTRDIALVVDSGVTHKQMQDIIKSFPLVVHVTLFDVYSGEQVPPGKKSLAYRLAFQSPDHTLTDEEAGKVQQQILDRLSHELGATLRA